MSLNNLQGKSWAIRRLWDHLNAFVAREARRSHGDRVLTNVIMEGFRRALGRDDPEAAADLWAKFSAHGVDGRIEYVSDWELYDSTLKAYSRYLSDEADGELDNESYIGYRRTIEVGR